MTRSFLDKTPESGFNEKHYNMETTIEYFHASWIYEIRHECPTVTFFPIQSPIRHPSILFTSYLTQILKVPIKTRDEGFISLLHHPYITYHQEFIHHGYINIGQK